MFIKYSNSGGSSEDRYSVYRAPRLGQARGFRPDGNLLKQFLRYCLHIEAVKHNKYSLVPLDCRKIHLPSHILLLRTLNILVIHPPMTMPERFVRLLCIQMQPSWWTSTDARTTKMQAAVELEANEFLYQKSSQAVLSNWTVILRFFILRWI